MKPRSSNGVLYKRAFQLWRRYKTDTCEYREIAERLGMNTAELNKKCWWNHYSKQRREQL